MNLKRKFSLLALSFVCALASFFAVQTTITSVKKEVKAETAQKYLYLSDLSVSETVNLENYTLNTTLSPNDVKNGAITLKLGGGGLEQEFSKAITFNRLNSNGGATKEGGVKFNLPSGAKRFTANIGINYVTSQWGNMANYPTSCTATFKVYLLKNGSWTQVDCNKHGKEYTLNKDSISEYVDVDLTGATQIYLATAGDGDAMSEHAVWANPKIYGTNLSGGTETTSLYLSEFPISYIDYQDYYTSGTQTVAINHGYPYGDVLYPPLQLRVNGARKNYEKGISVQANAKFGYDISGTNAYRLTATIGLQQRDNMDINESATDRGSVIFKVNYRWFGSADKNLYTSKTFYRNTDAVDIDIAIPYGASHVSFIVEDAGDGFNFDNATWADLKLWCDGINVSDMTVYDYKVGFASLMLDQVAEGKPTLCNVINENGTILRQEVQFDKCVFMHTDSYVTYDLRGMNAVRFTAFAGIVSSKKNSYELDGRDLNWKQPTTFNVYTGIDNGGTIAWTQIATYSLASRLDQMIKIDCNNLPTNTQFIKIEAKATYGDTNSGHAVLCMPRIYGNNVFGTKNISLSPANDSLVSGETAKIKLYTTSFNNVVTEKTNFTLSSNTNVFTVDNTNKTYTANGLGSGNISVNYVENGKQFSTFFKALSGNTTGNNNNYKQLVVKSPDGKTKIIITHHDGWIDYSATKDGNLFVEKSRIGVLTSLGEMKMNFGETTIGTQKTINETYNVYSGKYDKNVNYCNENTITFTYTNGAKFIVTARAYNDGVAFRCTINNNGKDFTVSNEDTSVTIPFFSKFWTMPMPGGANKTYTHEQYASEQVISSFAGAKTIPLIYKTPDNVYVLLTEADMDGNYWGSVAYSEDPKIIRLNHSEQQQGSASSTNGVLQMPWRAFIAGSLEEVVKSVMVENLADAPDLQALRTKWGAGYENYDFSWVDPGISSWSWMDGLNHRVDGLHWFNPTHGAGYQGNPEAIINYIDLAAEMGWEYFILDEGWQPFVSLAERTSLTGLFYDNEDINTDSVYGYQNFYNWYYGVYDFMTDKSQYYAQRDTVTYKAGTYKGEKIIDYANKKGVKLIAWLHTGMCDTPARMDKVFKMLQDIGIAGIKIDFFDSENTFTMDLYDQMYELTAKYKLLGIFHGSNKPSGERRTWPHVINREAINGEENNNTKVYQHTISSYVRGTVGPTDLTPYIYTVGNGDTNMAAQMAFSIIYESGMTCFASTADEYRNLPENVKYYYKNFPGSWTDLKLLSGEIAKSMTIARKTDTGRWYIGNIGIKGTTETIKLDFLDSGKNYIAHIYQDVASKAQSVEYSSKTVQKGSSLTLTTHNDGGYVVVLEDSTKYSVSVSNKTGATVTANPTSCIAGTNVTVSVSVSAGYKVSSVSVTGSNYSETLTLSGNSATFTMPNVNVTITPNVVATTYTINKTIDGQGNVSFSKNSAIVGEQITVTATPSTGYQLSSIKVNGTAISGNKFTMPASNVTVTVTFTKISYTIQTSSANGSVSYDKNTANYGDTITVTITPNAGYKVTGVSVTGTTATGSGNNWSFTMPASNVTVTVTFEKISYTIQTSSANGNVSYDKNTANYGDTITVTVTPNAGYEVTGVSVTGTTATGSGNNWSFTMPASNVTVTVTYKEIITPEDSSSQVTPPTSSEDVSSEVTPPTSSEDVSSEVTPPTSSEDVSSEVTPPTSSEDVSSEVTPPTSNGNTSSSTLQPTKPRGCGGNVGAGIAFVPLMAMAILFIARKTKKDN